MIRVLFVCHGNICRSPMAEYVLRSLVDSSDWEIDSAATSSEEIGNPVYPPARTVLSRHGIKDINHRARQVTKEDYKYFDHIYVMDNWNLRNILRMLDNDPLNKISLLLRDEEIEDPWYTGNFERVYQQIERGCKRIIQERM